MSERVQAAWQVLPDYLSQHVLLSAASLLLGLVLSMPLVIAAVRSPRLRWPVLAFASLIQTIPSIALLALFYPVLLALSALSATVLGHGFSALGFLPSLLALTLYSMLPILRNGVTGIVNLDPAVIEAARGVGMTDWQRLLRIELPLAAPMLMAGVRTAAVWVIGTATLSTPVGQTSLGNYIFSGLQTENWVSVLFGCAAAALLALTVDQLLGIIETGAARRRGRRVVVAAAILVFGVTVAAVAQQPGRHSAYVIGAKSFSEQYILAALFADRLSAAGAAVEKRTGLGSVIVFRALANGDIDAYVDYSGTLWANAMGRSDNPARAQALAELGKWLQGEHGVKLLGALGFENAYALAMRHETADKLGVRSIADLARLAPRLRIGGDFEFFSRPEWHALRDSYGLAFAERRQFQSTFMYKAVANGEVDVISAFSSDGRIAAYDLVVLEDPHQAILPYDAVVLVSARRSHDTVLCRALAPLIGAIPIERMREANLMVDRDVDKVTPPEAARWLAGTIRLQDAASADCD
jgi:osmoprotectant transport system permease protein